MKRSSIVAIAFVIGLLIVVYLAVTTDDVNPQLGSGSRVPAEAPASPQAAVLYLDRPRFVSSTTSTTTTPAPRVRAASASPAPRPTTPSPAIAELERIIRDGFARFGPAVAEEAVDQAWCETGGTLDPNSTGAEGEVGLLQIHPRYHTDRAAKFGWTMADLYDPAKNVAVAADIYSESRWDPWTCKP